MHGDSLATTWRLVAGALASMQAARASFGPGAFAPSGASFGPGAGGMAPRASVGGAFGPGGASFGPGAGGMAPRASVGGASFGPGGASFGPGAGTPAHLDGHLSSLMGTNLGFVRAPAVCVSCAPMRIGACGRSVAGSHGRAASRGEHLRHHQRGLSHARRPRHHTLGSSLRPLRYGHRGLQRPNVHPPNPID